MTTEFRIDRPGVYRRRDGVEKCLWPTFSSCPLRWVAVGDDAPVKYMDTGELWIKSEESFWDIVEYIGPLPADILQRMAEALWAAEGKPGDDKPATFGEALKAMTEEPTP